MAERIIAPLASKAEFTEIYKSLAKEAGMTYTSDVTCDMFYGIYERLIETSKFAITECAAVAERHLVDSALLPHLLCERGLMKSGDAICDIGAGAGFPTLPMAALSQAGEIPSVTVHAVDSTAKKVRYITETAGILGLSGVLGSAGRAEELAAAPQGKKRGGAMREKFDIVTARAVSALPVLIELAAPFVKVGGIFAAMKAHSEEEVAAAARGANVLGLEPVEVIDYALPSGDARTLVIYKKVKNTPDAYPRQYARITKEPL